MYIISGLMLAIFIIFILLLNLYSYPTYIGVPIPKYKIKIDIDSSEGFVSVEGPPYKLVIRQGDTGSINITLRRMYTNKTLWILLRLYGIGPDFNKSIPGLYPGQSLPSGVTYAINPSLVRLSTDDKYTATLVIYVSPNTTPRSYKLSLDSILIYPVEKESVSVTTLSILLVVLPKE